MIVKLDSEACQGHGRCYALAGDLFDSDDEGYAVLKTDGTVPAGLEDAARLAADNCPEFAITVED
ncbi:MAG: ferredoxin [Acidimicrobiales bacterium]